MEEEERNPRRRARVLAEEGVRVLEEEGAMNGENAEAADICRKPERAAGSKRRGSDDGAMAVHLYGEKMKITFT